MINTITILNKEYEIPSSFEKISIADSFVLPKNRIGGGTRIRRDFFRKLLVYL